MPLIIRIQQHDFALPQRYEPGHVCTPGEAAALNQVFAENIRNNVSRWVATVLFRSQSGLLSAEDHSYLQNKISEYADGYQFRAQERTRPPGPLEATAEEIARQQAEIEGQQEGLPADSADVRLRTLQLKSHPAILAKARELLALRRETLKDILNDPDV